MLEKSKVFDTIMFDTFTRLNHIIDDYNINPLLVDKNNLSKLGQDIKGYKEQQNTYNRVLSVIPKQIRYI